MRQANAFVLRACLLGAAWTLASTAEGQVPFPTVPANGNMTTDAQGRPVRRNTGNDSLRRRDFNEDSVTIRYRYWDSVRTAPLDTSISNFYDRWPLPQDHVDLGNAGTAARPLVYRPNTALGFDHGFHSFRPFHLGLANARFFETTRPFTQLGYFLGARAEQYIDVLHTQNRNPRFNFAIEYRLLTSPGAFRNQNTAHRNLRFTSNFSSRNRRYAGWLVLASNRNRSAENGGLRRTADLDSLALNNPFELPTRLGGSAPFRVNPFSTNVVTGSNYSDGLVVLRQQYDFGQKDSLRVNDTTVVPLFYPRLRLVHTLRYERSNVRFQDYRVFEDDYRTYYNLLVANDSLVFADRYTVVDNEFAVVTYPDKQNQLQFLKLLGGYQWAEAVVNTGSDLRQGFYAGAEYRNRTRNRKWDLGLMGRLFATGTYAGDFSAQASVNRLLSQRLGYLQLAFTNTLRTPSFALQGPTSFPVLRSGNLTKENITEVSASLLNAFERFNLSGHYYVVGRAAYFNSDFQVAQDGGLFNLLRLTASTRFGLSRRINWYSTLHVQQATANAPVNVPLLLSINRIAYEGAPYKNLRLSTGLEIRYHTPYDPAGYSPLLGQFYVQQGFQVNNRPDVHAFFNFRITRFKGFVRMENLNTFNGRGFNKRNFTASNYAQNTTWLRFGIEWIFVN